MAEDDVLGLSLLAAFFVRLEKNTAAPTKRNATGTMNNAPIHDRAGAPLGAATVGTAVVARTCW
jgi:hypothetical protein